jgi:hypothetical protein
MDFYNATDDGFKSMEKEGSETMSEINDFKLHLICPKCKAHLEAVYVTNGTWMLKKSKTKIHGKKEAKHE